VNAAHIRDAINSLEKEGEAAFVAHVIANVTGHSTRSPPPPSPPATAPDVLDSGNLPRAIAADESMNALYNAACDPCDALIYGQSSTSTNSSFEVIYEDARRASVTIPGEPEVNSLETAKSSKYWPLIKEEIEGEIRGKLENEAFEAVSVFDDHGNRRRIMKTKWVITISFNADGTLRKIKCRVCGVWLFANRGQIFQGHLCVNAVRGFVPPMGVDRQ